ncbi:Uncharacterised protein [Mycobacteroides abscessus subsp. massiliense]|nr:Uncharacterised protein [Mycobacteroides abscessus subsp. massiliense]
MKISSGKPLSGNIKLAACARRHELHCSVQYKRAGIRDRAADDGTLLILIKALHIDPSGNGADRRFRRPVVIDEVGMGVYVMKLADIGRDDLFSAEHH